MEQKQKVDANQLSAWTISEFLKKLASEAPVPGGGSVAALSGALGAALIAMYAKLGMLRKGVNSDDQEILQKINIEASSWQNKLTRLITEDSLAYTQVMEAYKLPKTTDEETKARQIAIQRGFHVAVEIPLETMNACIECGSFASEPFGDLLEIESCDSNSFHPGVLTGNQFNIAGRNGKLFRQNLQ